jgi:transcriptional antiterminator RfaH
MTSQPQETLPRRDTWIVASSHVHQEHIALENLRRQNFFAYCPMTRKRRSHARRVDYVDRPLFPGYLFINLDPARDHWRPVLSTFGIRSVVRFGEKLGMVGDGFISGLRAQEQDGLIAIPETVYQPGQKVCLSGPFEGVVATILHLEEKDRLVVLMEMLKSSVRVKVNAKNVTPV